MTLHNITLFQGMSAKTGYLAKRQEVIAQNLANADTPFYKERDLTEVDFGRVMTNVMKDQNIVRMDTTSKGHLPSHNSVAEGDVRKTKLFYEVAPGENNVIIEEQMVKSNKISMDHTLMMNLMKKNVGMLKMAMNTG